MMRFTAWILATTLACLLSACERTTRDSDIKFISVTEAKTLFDRVQKGESSVAIFIDPRPAVEFAQGHIPGARNITLANVKPTARIDPRLQRYANLVIYGNDPASATARGLTKRLLAVGYGDVRCFAGGLEEWQLRGYPLETSPLPVDPDAPPAPEPVAAPVPEPPSPAAPSDGG